MPPPDLAALHAQLALLERQKAKLAAHLLAVRAERPVAASTATSATANTTATPPVPTSTPAPPPPPAAPIPDSQLLAHVFAAADTSQAAALTRFHRMTGITTFTVRDPSPPHEKLLGVRIDVGSQRKFLNPHYILLTLPPTPTPAGTATKGPGYTVHRHTLPPWLSITRLQKLKLPVFVRAVRRLLVLHAGRVAAATGVQVAGRAAGVEVSWDDEVKVVNMQWEGGRRACGTVSEEGRVVGVVVREGDGARGREVERVLRGGLEGVGERMGW